MWMRVSGFFLVVCGDDVGGVIGGSVDHDEQFKVGVCLVSDGLYGVDDGVGGVVDRHDDAGTRGTHKFFLDRYRVKGRSYV